MRIPYDQDIIDKIGPETRTNVSEDKQKPVSSYEPNWLKVNSFEELMKHEKAILDRITHTKYGGNLFMAHPFMLLADIGVVLSDAAKKEIIRREPSLASLSKVPYEAIKTSSEKPSIRFFLHGLFDRRSS